MIIKDNIVTFEPSDTKKFSPAYQRALLMYLGERAVIENELSRVVNGLIASAISKAKATQLSRLEALAKGQVVESDPVKIEQVNELLNKAREVIGVPVEGAPPPPPPKKGFLSGLLSRFKR